MEGSSSGGGSHVEAHIPVMLTAAKSMQAVSAQMLSTAVPTAVPPAGLDEVSLKAAARLNSRAVNLVKTIDSGSWMLAGGAAEVENAAHSFLAKEAENAGSFTGTSLAGGVPAPQLPAFPAPPTIPDLTLPDVPAPPGAIDAEYTSMLVNGGSGAAPHTAAAEFWTNTGRSLGEVSDVLGVARDALRNGWQSPDAEGAHSALQKFHAWVDDTGKSATQLGQDWSTHVAGWQRVRDNIPTPQDASQTKQNLVQAMDENAANGGMSTPKVVQWGNEYTQQNSTAQTEMASYDAGESSAPPFADPGAPPQISAAGLPRVDGIPRPAPGPLQDRLTDDPAMKGLQDPKAMMAALMAAVGGLGAISQAGKGLLQPLQQIPQQIAQQVSQIGQMAKSAGAANAASIPHKATTAPVKKAGAGGGGKGGGGTKPAGLGGGARLSTPPPAAMPAAPSTPAVVRPPAAGAGAPGGAGMGMMPPMGAMGAAARGGNQKDKSRNKDLFPDSQEFDDDGQDHAPAVLGAKPEAVKKPSYDRKIGSAPIKND